MATAEKPKEGAWSTKVAESMMKAVGIGPKSSDEPASGINGMLNVNCSDSIGE